MPRNSEAAGPGVLSIMEDWIARSNGAAELVEREGVTGRYFENRKPSTPAPAARLWDGSAKLVGL